MAANTHSAYFDLNQEDYASIAGASCPNLELTEGTFEFWFKVDPAAPDDQWTAIGKYLNPSDCSYHVYLEGNSGVVNRFYLVYTLDGNSPITKYWPTAGSLNIPKDEWHHYALSYRAADARIRYYVDGAPLGNKTGTIGNIYQASAAGFFLGAKNTAYPQHWAEGDLDQVRVWSRVLDDDEIAANYLWHLQGDESDLEAYYRLDNNWNDSGPNGYDLTPGAGAAAPVFTTDHAPTNDLPSARARIVPDDPPGGIGL
jgi:hypothetical protein